MENKSIKKEKTKTIKSIEDDEDKKYRRLYRIDEAPEYLRHNVYILSGYRGILNTKHCIER